MSQLMQLPEWLGGAVIGAIIAALGYVAKLIFDGVVAALEARNVRLARLVELHSLLRAGKVCYKIQNAQAIRLTKLIEKNHSDLEYEEGYEEIMSKAFAQLTPEEKELHRIIRGITIHAMRPINKSLSEWLKTDTYFKTQQQARSDLHNVESGNFFGNKYASCGGTSPEIVVGSGNKLPKLLADLDVHLLLWHAKYEEWIPDTPEHALVYLADEKEHGVGFPSGLDKAIEDVLKKIRWFDLYL